LAGESGFAQAGETRHFGAQARTVKIGQVLPYGNGYEARFLYQANGYG
jgi:succinylglutamate desuccinylase